MGRGIAQAVAAAGYDTTLFDINQGALENAHILIKHSMEELVSKNRLTATEAGSLLERIHYTNSIADCKADLVIEAALEDPAIKKQIFREMEEVNDEHCILTTNTSSLSVTMIAGFVQRPHRVAGLHFFNPAPIMKLVEVVRTPLSSSVVIDSLHQFVLSIGKTPVTCQDAPGFIVNHVARPYYLEALRLMHAGVDVLMIDEIMEATGFKMGPFKLMDLIGNDINYAVSVSVYNALGQPSRLEPPDIQKQLVEENKLGRKAGSGFYDYNTSSHP